MGRILSLSITLTSLVFAEQISSIEYRGAISSIPQIWLPGEFPGIQRGGIGLSNIKGRD